MTPFKVLYEIDPPMLPHFTLGEVAVEVVEVDLQQREEILQSVKRNLEVAPLKMKTKVDGSRREWEFAEGDWVLVRLKPYKQKSVS